MNSTAPPFADMPAPGARPRCSFALSVAAAVGVNVVALSGLATATAPWQGSLDPAGASTWITAVMLPPRASAEPSVAALASSQARRVGSAPATSAAAPATSRHAARPQAASAADEAGRPMHFYRSDEVDRPAEPDSDWNLDPVTFAAAGLRALVFEIFIGRQGEVVGCTIVEPEALPPALRDALEERLRQTVLQPAFRAGVPVASVRRIEVSVL